MIRVTRTGARGVPYRHRFRGRATRHGPGSKRFPAPGEGWTSSLCSWVCLAIRGPRVRFSAFSFGAGGSSPGGRVAGTFGLRPESVPAPTFPEAVHRCGSAAWEAARIEAGIPVMGTRGPPRAPYPAESGPGRTSGFPLTKGVFHRPGAGWPGSIHGGPRWRGGLCGIVLDDPEQVPHRSRPRFTPPMVSTKWGRLDLGGHGRPA